MSNLREVHGGRGGVRARMHVCTPAGGSEQNGTQHTRQPQVCMEHTHVLRTEKSGVTKTEHFKKTPRSAEGVLPSRGPAPTLAPSATALGPHAEARPSLLPWPGRVTLLRMEATWTWTKPGEGTGDTLFHAARHSPGNGALTAASRRPDAVPGCAHPARCLQQSRRPLWEQSCCSCLEHRAGVCRPGQPPPRARGVTRLRWLLSHQCRASQREAPRRRGSRWGPEGGLTPPVRVGNGLGPEPPAQAPALCPPRPGRPASPEVRRGSGQHLQVEAGDSELFSRE